MSPMSSFYLHQNGIPLSYYYLAKSTQAATIASTTETELFNREKRERHERISFRAFRVFRGFSFGCGFAAPGISGFLFFCVFRVPRFRAISSGCDSSRSDAPPFGAGGAVEEFEAQLTQAHPDTVRGGPVFLFPGGGAQDDQALENLLSGPFSRPCLPVR